MDAATVLAENQTSSEVIQFRPSWIMQEGLQSLSSKFPLLPGSQGSVVFCTTQLSEKLQQPPLDADFDMTDPFSPPPEYHVLHDAHLKEFFKNPTMKKRLKDKGFITEDGYVKCNLREFNEYRKWVRKLKLDAYHREQRDEREKWERQRRERDVERHLLRDRDLYQITKVREHKAKEMMEKRRKKREADKRKFMKLEEEDMKRREKFEDERRRRKDLVEAKREKQLERKCRVKQKQDEKVRKIRIRFSQKRKDEEDNREMKIQERRKSVVEEKSQEMKVKFQRRCSLLVEQAEVKRCQEQHQKEEHRRNVQRRTSHVQAQRRKSQALLDHTIKVRRGELEKELADAEHFLEKVRAKKQRELEQWKVDHQPSRGRKLSGASSSHKKLRRASDATGHSRQRLRSVWDVHSSLMKDLVNEEGGETYALSESECLLGSRTTLPAIKEQAVSQEITANKADGQIPSSRASVEIVATLQQTAKTTAGVIMNGAENLMNAQEIEDEALKQTSAVVVRRAIFAAYQRWVDQAGVHERERIRGYVLDIIEVSLDSPEVVGSCAALPAPDDAAAAKELIHTAVAKASEKLPRQEATGKSEVVPERIHEQLSDVDEESKESEVLQVSQDKSNEVDHGKESTESGPTSHVSQEKLSNVALILAEETIANATACIQHLGEMAYEVDKETGMKAITQKLAADAIDTASKSIQGLDVSGDIDSVVEGVIQGALIAASESLEALRDLNARAPYLCKKESPVIVSDYEVGEPADEQDEQDPWDSAVKEIAKRAIRSAVASMERLETLPYQESSTTRIVMEAICAAKKSLELLVNPTEDHEKELHKKLQEEVKQAVLSKGQARLEGLTVGSQSGEDPESARSGGGLNSTGGDRGMSVDQVAAELAMSAIVSAQNSIERFFKQELSTDFIRTQSTGESQRGVAGTPETTQEQQGAAGMDKQEREGIDGTAGTDRHEQLDSAGADKQEKEGIDGEGNQKQDTAGADQQEQEDVPSEDEQEIPVVDDAAGRGGTMCFVMRYVEGIINYALNTVREEKDGYVFVTHEDAKLTVDEDTYVFVTHEEAKQADLEYPALKPKEETYQRVARELVNTVIQRSVAIVKSEKEQGSEFESVKRSRRRSSVHFSERSISCTRRESYVPRESDFLSVLNRPPTPVRRRDPATEDSDLDEEDEGDTGSEASDIDNSLDNVEGEQDSDHDKVAEGECGNLEIEENEGSSVEHELDVNAERESREGSRELSREVSREATREVSREASREGTPGSQASEGKESGDRPPSSVSLPPLSPSDHSLVAASIAQAGEAIQGDVPKTSAPGTGDLPAIPKKRSLVGIVDSESQENLRGELESAPRGSSVSHLPELSSGGSALVASSSVSSLKSPSGDLQAKETTDQQQNIPPSVTMSAHKSASRESKAGESKGSFHSSEQLVKTSLHTLDQGGNISTHRTLSAKSSLDALSPHSASTGKLPPPSTSGGEIRPTPPSTPKEVVDRQSVSLRSSVKSLESPSLVGNSGSKIVTSARDAASSHISIRTSSKGKVRPAYEPLKPQAILTRKSSTQSHSSRASSTKTIVASASEVSTAPKSVSSSVETLTSSSQMPAPLASDGSKNSLDDSKKGNLPSDQLEGGRAKIPSGRSEGIPSSHGKDDQATSGADSKSDSSDKVEASSTPKDKTHIDHLMPRGDRIMSVSTGEGHPRTIPKSRSGRTLEISQNVSHQSKRSALISHKESDNLPSQKSDKVSSKSSLKSSKPDERGSKVSGSVRSAASIEKRQYTRGSKENASISSVQSKKASPSSSGKTLGEKRSSSHQAKPKVAAKVASGPLEDKDKQVKRSVGNESSVSSSQDPEVVIWREVVKKKESITGEKKSDGDIAVDETGEKVRQDTHSDTTETQRPEAAADDAPGPSAQTKRSSRKVSNVSLSPSSSVAKKRKVSYPGLSTVELKTNASVGDSKKQPPKPTTSRKQLSRTKASSSKQIKKMTDKDSTTEKVPSTSEDASTTFAPPSGSTLLNIVPSRLRQSSPTKTRTDSNASDVEVKIPGKASPLGTSESKVEGQRSEASAAPRSSDSSTAPATPQGQPQVVPSKNGAPSGVDLTEPSVDAAGSEASQLDVGIAKGPSTGPVSSGTSRSGMGVVGTAVPPLQAEVQGSCSSTATFVSASESLGPEGLTESGIPTETSQEKLQTVASSADSAASFFSASESITGPETITETGLSTETSQIGGGSAGISPEGESAPIENATPSSAKENESKSSPRGSSKSLETTQSHDSNKTLTGSGKSSRTELKQSSSEDLQILGTTQSQGSKTTLTGSGKSSRTELKQSSLEDLQILGTTQSQGSKTSLTASGKSSHSKLKQSSLEDVRILGTAQSQGSKTSLTASGKSSHSKLKQSSLEDLQILGTTQSQYSKPSQAGSGKSSLTELKQSSLEDLRILGTAQSQGSKPSQAGSGKSSLTELKQSSLEDVRILGTAQSQGSKTSVSSSGKSPRGELKRSSLEDLQIQGTGQSQGSKASVAASGKSSREELKRGSVEDLQIHGTVALSPPPTHSQENVSDSTTKPFSEGETGPTQGSPTTMLPRPPSGPKSNPSSPRISRIKGIPSDESTQLKTTESKTSLDSSATDEGDVGSRVSDFWISSRKYEILKVIGESLPTRAKSTSSLPNGQVRRSPTLKRAAEKCATVEIPASSFPAVTGGAAPSTAEVHPSFQVQGKSITNLS